MPKYIVEIPYPDLLLREGLIGTARVPNIEGLVAKEVTVIRDTVTAFGTTLYDVRIEGVSLFPNDAARPVLAEGVQSSVKAVADVAAPALGKIDFTVLDLGAGGGGMRPTLILVFEKADSFTGEEVSIDDSSLATIEGANAQEIVESIDSELFGINEDIDDINAPTGVVAGSYTNPDITVNANGRITAASNGSGGGGGASPTLYLSDDFNDGSLDAFWTNVAGFSESGGFLRYNSSLSGFLHSDLLNWFDKELIVKLVTLKNTTSNFAQMIQISNETAIPAGFNFSQGYGVRISNNSMTIKRQATTLLTLAYDAVNHVFMKLKFIKGGVVWQFSPDGADWATIYATGLTLDISNLRLIFGCLNNSTGGSTVDFDDVIINDYANV